MSAGQDFPSFDCRNTPALRISLIIFTIALLWCINGFASSTTSAEQSRDDSWIDALHPSSKQVGRLRAMTPENHAWAVITNVEAASIPEERVMLSEPYKNSAVQLSRANVSVHTPGATVSSIVIGDLYTDDERVLYGQDISLVLNQVTQLATYDKASVVNLESFCDGRGSSAYSMVVAERRASTTALFLRTLGIESERVSQASYGQENPPCTDPTVACWEDNIRLQKTFQALALKESKSGCLVRVQVASDAEAVRHIRTAPAPSFLKKVHLAESARRTAILTPRPLSH